MKKNNEFNAKSDEYRGYSNFNNTLNHTLQAWNRVNTIFNIKEQHGNVLASRYSQQFEKKALLSIHAIISLIKLKGYEQARREVFRKVVNV